MILNRTRKGTDLTGIESSLHPQVSSNSLIKIHPLQSPPAFLTSNHKWLSLAFSPLKVLLQACSLLDVLLLRTEAAEWIIVQVCQCSQFRLKPHRSRDVMSAESVAYPLTTC